jgi:hypothetical protein
VGQKITWIVPHALSQVLPEDVDYRVMLTFLEFYEVSRGPEEFVWQDRLSNRCLKPVRLTKAFVKLCCVDSMLTVACSLLWWGQLGGCNKLNLQLANDAGCEKGQFSKPCCADFR